MKDNPGKTLALLKTGLFTVIVPGTVAFYIPLALALPERRWAGWPAAAWQYLGLPFLLSGTAIYLWCAWDFAVTGLGTPAPIDAPRVLVVKGLYRFVRNPMYVGVLSVLLGWSLWFASKRLFLYFAAVGLAVHLFTVSYEEPHLRKMFGPQYENYCRRVNRWLPRFSRANGSAHRDSLD
jgi:protein-S-isoprenylcysteine O-methyltransferase Ste14